MSLIVTVEKVLLRGGEKGEKKNEKNILHKMDKKQVHKKKKVTLY